MMTDVDIILYETVVKQLDLYVYAVMKPGVNLGSADSEDVTEGHVFNILANCAGQCITK